MSVSIVKLWVPRIHLLISGSFFPKRMARSFCLNPFLSKISCILSTIRNEKSTALLVSGLTLFRLCSIILLLFILKEI